MNQASSAIRILAVLALLTLLAPSASEGFAQVPRYTLGVRGTYTPDGMRIDAVAPGSPAEKVGLQRGDLILKIDGQTVLNQQDFAGAIDGSQGSAILIVRKGNNPRPVRLIADLVGNSISRWTAGPYLLGIIGTFTPQGMRVGHVVPGTPAERTGLKGGDVVMAVNGRPVTNQNELFAVLNSSGGKVALHVRRANGQGVRLDADLAQHTLGVVGEFTRDGLVVGVAAPGTPAERYGLQRGDLIVRVEGQMVRNQTELDNVLANSGGLATLLVRKAPNGAPARIQVDLTNNPLGAWCEPVPDGMRVTTVAPGTPAERIGLERGDLIRKVDDRPVRSQAELSAALFNSGGSVTLSVRKPSTGRDVRMDADLVR
jgi:S1-C subfamily serine protease